MFRSTIGTIVFVVVVACAGVWGASSFWFAIHSAQAHENQQNQHEQSDPGKPDTPPTIECRQRLPEQEARFVEDGIRRREIVEPRCLDEEARPTTQTLTGAYGRMQDPGSFIEHFHVALYSGDWDTVYNSFHPDVLISEMGVLEDGLDAYFETHLNSEKELLKALSRSYLGQQITVYDGVAWATTTQRLRGHYDGQDYDVHQVETMVLMNGPNGWKIRQVHWSHFDDDHEGSVGHH